MGEVIRNRRELDFNDLHFVHKITHKPFTDTL